MSRRSRSVGGVIFPCGLLKQELIYKNQMIQYDLYHQIDHLGRLQLILIFAEIMQNKYKAYH